MIASPPFDWVIGEATGLAIPAHPAALLANGADFLTAAFQRYGSLAADNRVERIVAAEPCVGGSTGAKLFLTVEYARADPRLHTRLFAKFSRDFTDERRDWQRHEMEGEARFGPITRLRGFPIEVPVYYFSDYDSATGTGLAITERIGFGQGGIEAHRHKTMDHLHTPDPLPYYRASITALARLAGAHKAGRLAGDIATRFPLDLVTASADRIFTSEAEMAAQLDQGEAFLARAPQLFPAEVRDPAFLARVRADAWRIRAHEAAIQQFLTADPDYIALCHWNAHIDNAFFCRDADGTLHCGLIDWGRVGQITLGSALWGGLSAAHHSIWDEHLDELLALFCAEYRAAGGPALTPDALLRHLTLHVAMMGVARVLAFPEIIRFRLPQVVDADGPYDPMLLASDPARNCLHVYTVFLKLWQRQDFGAALEGVLAQV